MAEKISRKTIKLEIFQGELKHCTAEISPNLLSSKTFTLKFLLNLIELYFRDLSNLIYWIAEILFYFLENNTLFQIYGIALIFSLFSFILQEVYFENSRKNQIQSLDYREINVFSPKSRKFEICDWKDIQVGQIILLKKNELCPADILILDSENKIYIDSSRMNGKTSLSMKFSLISTTVERNSKLKGEIEDYSKFLTGEIEYDTHYPKDLNDFKGYLKLINDPSGDNIGLENIILHDSELMISEWVIGLVLFAGGDCYSFQKILYHPLKKNVFENEINKIHIISFITIILWLLISIIVYTVEYQRFLPDTETKNNLLKSIFFFSLYLYLIPFSLFALLRIINLISSNSWQKHFLKQDQSFRINESKYLSNLGEIDHIFLDKTGVLTTKEIDLSFMLIDNKIFSFSKLKTCFPKTRKMLSLHSKIEPQTQKERSMEFEEDIPPREINLFEYTPSPNPKANIPKHDYLKTPIFIKTKNFEKELASSINDRSTPEKEKKNVNFGEFNIHINKHSISSFKITNSSEKQKSSFDMNKSKISIEMISNPMINLEKEFETEEYFRRKLDQGCSSINKVLITMLLCSQLKNSDYTCLESCFKEEEIIIKFCQKYSYCLEEKIKTEDCRLIYNLRSKENYNSVNIISIHEYSQRGRYGILISNEDKGGTLYLKGYFHKMIGILKLIPNERSILTEFTQEACKLGQLCIIYAEKKLSANELEEYQKSYRTLKSKTSSVYEDEWDKFFQNQEIDLELISIICVEEKLKEGSIEAIELFHNIGIKPWLLSADPFHKVLPVAYANKLITNSEIWHIIGNDLDELKTSIKFQIEKVLEQLKRKESLDLSITITSTEIMGNSKLANFGSMKSSNFDKRSTGLNFGLLTDGKTLEILLNDEYCKSHLLFLLVFCKSVIGYNITPLLKRKLVKTIRKIPLKDKILSIGYSNDNWTMLQNSDLSIQMTYEDNYIVGDLSLNEWKLIKDLIILKGRQLFERNELAIFLTVYHAIIITFPSFVINFYCGFAGVMIFDFMMYFNLFCWGIQIPTFFLIFFGQKINEQYLLANFILYREPIKRKKSFFYNLTLFSIVPGIIHSSFMLFFEILFVLEGQPIDFDQFNFNLYIKIIFIIYLRFVSLSQQEFKLMMVVICTIIFGIQGLIMWISYYQYQLREGFKFSFFANYNLMLIMTILFNFLYDSETFLPKLKNFPTEQKNKGKFKRKVQKKLSKLSNDSGILQKLKRKINIKKIVKQIFKKIAPDPLIKEVFFDPTQCEIDDTSYDRLTLKFRDKTLEKRFGSKFSTKEIHIFIIIYWVILILTGLYFVYQVYTVRIMKENSNDGTDIYIKLAIIVFYFILGCFIFNKKILKNTLYSLIIVISLGIITKSFYVWYMDSDSTVVNNPVILATFSNLLLGPNYVLIFSLIIDIEGFIRAIYFFSDESNRFLNEDFLRGQPYIISNLILLNIAITTFSIVHNYKYELLIRNEFLVETNYHIQSNSVSDVLSILLPKFVRDQLSQSNIDLTEDQGEVTILFCDICDFDIIIEEEKNNIIAFLDVLYRNFDLLCQQNGVQKIETVGKTYMACSGLRSCDIVLPKFLKDIDQTERALNLALTMRNFVEQYSYGNGNQLSVKIGLHYGRAIAGVIGQHKPQFSLIGDTINTASRVCSNCESDVITISEQAYERVKNNGHEYKERKIEAKGKGSLTVFEIGRKKGKNFEVIKSIRKSKMKSDLYEDNDIFKRLNFINRVKSREGSGFQLMSLQHEKSLKKKDTVNEVLSLSGKTSNINKKIKTKPKISGNIKLSINTDKNESQIESQINSSKFLIEEEDPPLYYNLPEIMNLQENDKEFNDRNQIEILKSNWFLNFKDNQYELSKTFYSEIEEINSSDNITSLIFLLVVYLLKSLIVLLCLKLTSYILIVQIICRISSALILSIVIFFRKYLKKIKKNYLALLFVFYSILISFSISCIYTKGETYLMIELIELMFVFLIMSSMSCFRFKHLIIMTISLFVFWILVNIHINSFEIMNLSSLFIFSMIIIFQFYTKFSKLLKNFNQIRISDFKQNQQKDFLMHLMPKHILNKILEQTKLKSDLIDNWENITLLFADIAGFTKYSSSVSAENVVSMLRNLFTAFDNLSVDHHVYKVYTIGDCYVVMSLNENSIAIRNPIEEAINVIEMGFSMIETIKRVRKDINFKELNMRIGIHTGKIIGGVIGSNIVRYDIYGRDVMIANKMESNGLEGYVNISESTKNLLEENNESIYSFQEFNNVYIKSIDKYYKSYLVQKNNLIKDDNN